MSACDPNPNDRNDWPLAYKIEYYACKGKLIDIRKLILSKNPLTIEIFGVPAFRKIESQVLFARCFKQLSSLNMVKTIFYDTGALPDDDLYKKLRETATFYVDIAGSRATGESNENTTKSIQHLIASTRSHESVSNTGLITFLGAEHSHSGRLVSGVHIPNVQGEGWMDEFDEDFLACLCIAIGQLKVAHPDSFPGTLLADVFKASGMKYKTNEPDLGQQCGVKRRQGSFKETAS